MVDIFVGAERKKFHLHRDLLCDRSDYFTACFAGNFKEAQQKELFLPEDDIEVFDLFVRWLYGGPLEEISSNDDRLSYLALSLLANKFCLERLQNEATDHILNFNRTHPVSVDYQYLHYIYQNTCDPDVFRIYSISLAAWMTVSKQVDEITTDHQRLIREGGDLAVDFSKWLSFHYHSKGDPNVIAVTDPRDLFPNCSYHTHNLTPACSDASK